MPGYLRIGRIAGIDISTGKIARGLSPATFPGCCASDSDAERKSSAYYRS